MSIKEYLKNNILITDGAMGTYYSEITGKTSENCVLANLSEPEVIEKIHKEYIIAGAGIIRTNTFCANTVIIEKNIDFVKKIVMSACKIAKKAVIGTSTFIGASIGPIPDGENEADHTREYFDIIDCFINEGIEIFIFETFYSLDYVLKLSDYIKQKNKNAFVITQFSVNDAGITRKSLGIERIVSEIKRYKNIDVVGFNCGMGPLHMLNRLKSISNTSGKMISALPNAGYPEFIDNKVEYVMNPKYFAKTCAKMVFGNVRIIGGCCGTTPEHIRLLAECVENNSEEIVKDENFVSDEKQKSVQKVRNNFHRKIENGEFIIAVELDPPFKTSVDRIIEGASVIKKSGADIITIADSPMGKSRADSMIISAKIKRETGAEVLPHICCRDRNSISLRSSVLAGYIEGIRNFLAVTGDPVPGELKRSIKGVFDLNSYSLINMIYEMNNDVFDNEYIKIGGAVNFNVKNKQLEYERLLKKAESGAEFFLSQPIFTDDAFEFVKKLPKKRSFRILGGIMPLVSYRNVQFINNELSGITIPEKYAERFLPDMERDEAEKTGIETAVEIAETIRDYVDGFYIVTPFNRYEMVSKILRRLLKNE